MSDLGSHLKDLLGAAAGAASASHIRQIASRPEIEKTTKTPEGERKEKFKDHSPLGDAYHAVMAALYFKAANYLVGDKVREGATDLKDWLKEE